MPAPLEVQPGKVHLGVQRLDMHLAVTDLDNQQALLGQMVRRLGQHPPYQVQAVFATGQAQLGFVLVFLRHVGKILGIHIRRIGHDQVETLAGQTVEAIALDREHPLIDAMALDILVGHFQCFERQVGQHHFRLLELIGTGDTDATGAGAQVENPRRLVCQPRSEAAFDQLANRRTRNQHPLVDDKRHAAEPCLTQQVGGGHTVFDATLEQVLHVAQLIVFQAAVEVAVGDFPRQVQGPQDQLTRLVPGIVGAMAEKQIRAMEAADSPTNMVAQRAQAGSDHGGRLLEKKTGDSNSQTATR